MTIGPDDEVLVNTNDMGAFMFEWVKRQPEKSCIPYVFTNCSTLV